MFHISATCFRTEVKHQKMKRQYIPVYITVLLWCHLPLVWSDVPMSNGKAAVPESVLSARPIDTAALRTKAQILEMINDPKINELDLDEVTSQVKSLYNENVLDSNDIQDLIAAIRRKKLQTVPQTDAQSQPLDTEASDTTVTQKKTSSDSSSSRAVKGVPLKQTTDNTVPKANTGKPQTNGNIAQKSNTLSTNENGNSAPKPQMGQVKSNGKPALKANNGPQKTKGNPGPKPNTGPQKAKGNPGPKSSTGPQKANGNPGPKPKKGTQNANQTPGPHVKAGHENPTKENEDLILPVRVFKNVGKFVGGVVG